MLVTPTITITRHAAYDEVSSTNVVGLHYPLWVALAEVSGHPAGPAGAVPPFPPLPGPPPGYRVPPAVGERLLAARPPAAGVDVVDRRGPPAVTPDPARVAGHAWNLRAAAAAAAKAPRGFLTTADPDDRPPLAALMAKACGPVGGVVLVRDGPQAEEVDHFCAAYRVGAVVIRNAGARADRVCPRPPGPAVRPDGAWVVVPAGHPAWAAGLIPDPPVVVAADAVAACRPKILARLFGRPDQVVVGLLRTDRAHRPDDLHRVAASCGVNVHDLQPG